MIKFLNGIKKLFSWIMARPETKVLLNDIQAKILADGKIIAQIAIAEVMAGNITSNEDKRKAAIERIKQALLVSGKAYPDWAYNWLIEHVYANFANKQVNK